MLARYSVRSSDCDGDVVTSLRTSLSSEAFSIAAQSRLSPVSATSESIGCQLMKLHAAAAVAYMYTGCRQASYQQHAKSTVPVATENIRKD